MSTKGHQEHLFIREVTRRTAKSAQGVSDISCVAAQSFAGRLHFASAAAGDVSDMCPFSIRSEFNPAQGRNLSQFRPIHTA